MRHCTGQRVSPFAKPHLLKHRASGMVSGLVVHEARMLENLELIAVMLDNDGKVTFCNDALLSLTGWTREEVVGRTWFDKFLPDSDEVTERLFHEGIHGTKNPRRRQNQILQ